MDQRKIHILETMPVRQAIVKLAVPTMLGMIVQIFYNLTDAFFVGKLNDPNQVAAVAITMPFFMMLLALSGIFGNGGASYLSRLLGQKDYARARQTVATAWFSCLGVGVLAAIFGLIGMRGILALSGASPQTYPFAAAFLRIILLGSPIIMLNFTAGQLLRAEGAAKEAMFGMALGTAVNILLNPLFVFVLRHGVAGSATATVIGNVVGLVYYLSYYARRKSLIPLSFKAITLRLTLYAEIVKVGIPASLSQILMSIANAFVNNIAAGYGDIAVAAFGVDMRILMIPILLTIGLAAGAQPLIGYSYGARNVPRLKATILTAGKIGTGITLTFAALFACFPSQLIRAFINDSHVIATGAVIMRAFLIGLPFVGVQLVLMIALQAMGKGVPALIISLSRQGLIFVPAILLLNMFFGFAGMIYAQAVADIFSCLVAFGLFLRIVGQIEHLAPAQCLPAVLVYSGEGES